MRTLLSILLVALASPPTALGLGGAIEGLETAIEIQKEQNERFRTMINTRTGGSHQRRASPAQIPFKNPQAEKFFVDGTTIPDVHFDAGPSWAGLLPISGASNETRQLFFWFWPTTNPANSKDLVFWTNGMRQLLFFSAAFLFSDIIQVAPVAPLWKVSCRRTVLSHGPGVKLSPLRRSRTQLRLVC